MNANDGSGTVVRYNGHKRLKLSPDYELKHPKSDDNTICKVGLQDLPNEVLANLLKFDLHASSLILVNKRFLDVFAPFIYHEIHGLLPLIQSDEVPKVESLMVYGPQGFHVVNDSWLLKGKNMIQRIFTRPGYRVLQSTPIIGCYDLSSKRFNELKKITFVQDFRKLQHLCYKIINNEESIFRKYIHTFSVDVMFLDELQTSKIGDLRPLINKYAGRSYVTAETKRYQVYNNYDMGSFAELKSTLYDQYLEGKLSSEDREFWMAEDNVISKKIPFTKVPAMSKIYEMFLSGDRKKMMSGCKKSELLKYIDRFEDFRASDGRLKDETSLPGYITPFYIFNDSHLKNKKFCQNENSKVEFKSFPEDDFATRNEVFLLIDALLEVTCCSDIKQRSLLFTSCMKDNSSKVLDRFETRVCQKQKALLINRSNKS